MKTNVIHQTSFVDPAVHLGEGNYIGPHCIIRGNVVIGNHNRFEAFCSIGLPGEYRGKESLGTVVIGDDNVIREFVTIHSALEGEDATVVGSACYLMTKSHIGHDTLLENDVTVSSLSIVGGHSRIMKGANLGLGSILHQRSVIGSYCLIGMGAVVTKKLDCVPGGIYVGNPAKYLKVNDIGLKRAKLPMNVLASETDRFFSIKELSR